MKTILFFGNLEREGNLDDTTTPKRAYLSRLGRALAAQGGHLVVLDKTSRRLLSVDAEGTFRVHAYERPRITLLEQRLAAFAAGESRSFGYASLAPALRHVALKRTALLALVIGLLSTLEYDGVVIWDVYEPLSLHVYSACKHAGIPVMTLESGVFPGTLEYDEVGYGAEGLSVRSSEVFEAISPTETELISAQRYIQEFTKRRISRRRHNPLAPADIDWLDAAPTQPLVFFAGSFQEWNGIKYPNTSYARAHSPHYRSDEDLLRDMVASAERKGFRIIYKSHPNAPLKTNLSSDRLRLVEQGDPYDCIDRAALVVGTCTTVTALALCAGKAALLAGTTGYSRRGVCYELDTRSELESKLQTALARGMTPEMKQRWVAYAARNLFHYAFAYSVDAEAHGVRDVDDTASMLLRHAEGHPLAFG